MINTTRLTDRQKIIEYFEGAGLDYYYWDKAFNMHFGYYRWGMNPFNLSELLLYWDIWRKKEFTTLTRERKNNALAPILGLIMGLQRKHFGYYMITGRKPD